MVKIFIYKDNPVMSQKPIVCGSCNKTMMESELYIDEKDDCDYCPFCDARMEDE